MERILKFIYITHIRMIKDWDIIQ